MSSALSTEVKATINGKLILAREEQGVMLTTEEITRSEKIAETVQLALAQTDNVETALAVTHTALTCFGPHCDRNDIQAMLDGGIPVGDLDSVLEACQGITMLGQAPLNSNKARVVAKPQPEATKAAAPESETDSIIAEATKLSADEAKSTPVLGQPKGKSLDQVSEAFHFNPELAVACYHAFWDQVPSAAPEGAFENCLNERLGVNYAASRTIGGLIDEVNGIASAKLLGVSGALL